MFKEAYKQTCLRRNFVISKENALINFNNVKNNQMQLKRWNSYSKKVKYANNISFEELMKSIEELINIIL